MPLQVWLQKVRRVQADAFVTPRPQGASIFALSQGGAPSSAGRLDGRSMDEKARVVMAGKGQSQVNCHLANAFSPRGTYMSCKYQMNTPFQRARTCTFSIDAKHDVHLGGS